MVNKKWLQLVKSLHQKKYRYEHRLFFVEGIKMVRELLATDLKPFMIFAYADFCDDFHSDYSVETISIKDLRSISALKNPNGILAVFTMPEASKMKFDDWIVVIDNVRDPGNLGTIIRLCDWYGIKHVVCSKHTVDLYNPKVLQATMGSIARVHVSYKELTDFLSNQKLPIYGAVMNGSSIYTEKLPDKGILVMGNESNGISSNLNKWIKNRVTIPQYGNITAESLNVSMATGILLNEIRRGH